MEHRRSAATSNTQHTSAEPRRHGPTARHQGNFAAVTSVAIVFTVIVATLIG